MSGERRLERSRIAAADKSFHVCFLFSCCLTYYQSKHSQRLLREKRVPSLTVCVAEFEDFAKIKGWDEEMYDQFGKAFKVSLRYYLDWLVVRMLN